MAQFKCTVLIMPNGLLKITGFPLDMNTVESSIKIEDQLVGFCNIINKLSGSTFTEFGMDFQFLIFKKYAF